MIRRVLTRLGILQPALRYSPPEVRRLCAKLPPKPTPCPVCDPEQFRRDVIHEGTEP